MYSSRCEEGRNAVGPWLKGLNEAEENCWQRGSKLQNRIVNFSGIADHRSQYTHKCMDYLRYVA